MNLCSGKIRVIHFHSEWESRTVRSESLIAGFLYLVSSLVRLDSVVSHSVLLPCVFTHICASAKLLNASIILQVFFLLIANW